MIYIDCLVLDILTTARFENDAIRQEHVALEKIWQCFKEDRIRLVTCDEQMEEDIIIGLNSLGCCVTDTIQMTDNIDEFEKWDKIDREEISQWRQIIDLFDELEILRGHDDYPRDPGKGQENTDVDKDLFTLLDNHVLKSERQNDYHSKHYEEDMAILQDCVNDLNNWYEKEAWRNLRRVEYNLHWKILENMLRKHSLEPVLHGEGATRNKYLLGLLNRVIGFGKKSCSQLPLEPHHARFIVDAVIKKYYHRQDRSIVHIVRCIEHNVDYLLSIDDALIDSFNKRRHLLLSHPYCRNLKLELVRPGELEPRLR